MDQSDFVYFLLMIVSLFLGYWAGLSSRTQKQTESGDYGSQADWWKNGDEPPEYGR